MVREDPHERHSPLAAHERRMASGDQVAFHRSELPRTILHNIPGPFARFADQDVNAQRVDLPEIEPRRWIPREQDLLA